MGWLQSTGGVCKPRVGVCSCPECTVRLKVGSSGLVSESLSTFWMVSSMDQPPFHGLVDFLMQLRLAILCHFLSSSFL